jgi:hypothetical protein
MLVDSGRRGGAVKENPWLQRKGLTLWAQMGAKLRTRRLLHRFHTSNCVVRNFVRNKSLTNRFSVGVFLWFSSLLQKKLIAKKSPRLHVRKPKKKQ